MHQERERLNRDLAKAWFSLPGLWLIGMLLATVLGMGSFVSSAELHNLQRKLVVQVAYTYHTAA